MHTFRKNEAGFGALPVLLIFIIIALVGITGWTIYKNQTKPSPTATQTKTTTAAPKLFTVSHADIPDGWTVPVERADNVAIDKPYFGCGVNFQRVYDKTARATDPEGLAERLLSTSTRLTRLPESTMIVTTDKGPLTIKNYPDTRYSSGKSVLDSIGGFIVRDGYYISIGAGCNQAVDDQSAQANTVRAERDKVIRSVKIDLSVKQ